MDTNNENRSAITSEFCAVANTTQSNRGTLASEQSDSAAESTLASRLSQKELGLMKFNVFIAANGRRSEEIEVLLSGLHPDDVKEIWQGSSRIGSKTFSFLTRAAMEGDFSMVKVLVAMGFDVNLRDGLHDTAVHVACTQENVEMVTFLLENGARTDLLDAAGYSCLTKASMTNSVEVMRCLLDHGVDPNKVDEGETPLHRAVAKGYLEMVKLLVAKGANVNHANTSGTMPLHIACMRDHLDVAKYLVEKGANVNTCDCSGATCLMLACSYRNPKLVSFLLDTGADPNQKTLNNWTALHISAEIGEFEAVELLVTKGADVNLTNSKHCTALLLACAEDQVEVAEYLLDSGARTDLTDDEGDNCLMVACRTDSVEVVQMLLRKGFDANYMSHSQQTLLHQAARSNSIEVAKLLLQYGAVLTPDNVGHTPLTVAIFNHSVDFVECMLEESSVTSVQEAEALELLAAVLMRQNMQQAYEYLHMAMRVRHSDPSDVLLKPHRPPVPALGNVVESQTLEEVESSRQDQDTLQWECLLAMERILGPADTYLHNYLNDTCHHFLRQNRHIESLALATYLLQLPHTDSDSEEDFLDLLLNSYSPTFQQIRQVLEAAVFQMEQGYRALGTNTIFRCIKLALRKLTDEDERNQLQVLVQRLIATQLTDADGSNVLHFAVSHYDNLSPVDEDSVPLVAFLLQCGADVNASCSFGDTALHIIVDCEEKDKVKTVCSITRMLLEAGCHIDLRNLMNQTALDCATMAEVRAILLEYYPLSLQCLAATAVVKHGIPYQDGVPRMVQNFINMHKLEEQ